MYIGNTATFTLACGIVENWDDYSRDPEQIYYVDLSEGVDGGSNPDWPYGSPENPRRTIPPTLTAGDLVQLSGQGAPGGRQTITASGTCDAPIFIRGAGPLDPATLRHGLHRGVPLRGL